MTRPRSTSTRSWTEAGWYAVPVPDVVKQLSSGTRAFQKDLTDGHLSVFVGPEPEGWHLSMSHRSNLWPHPPGRYPTWDELKEARYLFCPGDITMAQLLPPLDEYVNNHPTTFHLWQVPNVE